MRNIKHKYIYTPLLFFILTLVLLFTACTSSAAENIPKDEVLKKFSEISSMPRTSDNLNELKSYIYDWANEHDLAVINDIYGNIIVDKKASNGRSKEERIIFQSYMDMIPYQNPNIIFDEKNDGIIPIVDKKTGNISAKGTNLGSKSSLGMANIMYLMENIQNNPPLRAIFTINGEGDMIGAQNINPTYLDGDLLINFNHDEHNSMVNQSYYSQNINFTTQVSAKQGNNNKAYVIAAVSTKDNNNQQVNSESTPIKSIANILATANGQGIMFEVASIEGGDVDKFTPSQVTTTIMLNEFESKQMHSIIKKHSSENGVSISMIETKKAKKVVDVNDSTRIISFLFNISESNITYISLSPNQFKTTVIIQAPDEIELENSIKEQAQLSGLSNIKLTKGEFFPSYYTPPFSSWIKNFSESYSALQTTEALNELGFLAKKNPDMKVLSIGVNIKNYGTTKELVALNTIDSPAATILLLLGGANETF